MSATSAPPGAPVVDFYDHNSPAYVIDRFDWFARIMEEHGPVVWSSLYGGHWIVIGAAELGEALQDWETFSSNHVTAPDGTNPEVGGIRYEGMFMPSRGISAPMIEQDPPDWTVPRKALTPLFTPRAVELWRQRIQTLVDACIDRRIESGSIDFAHDLANIVPAIFSLELAGVSPHRFEATARLYHVAAHLASDDPLWAELAPLAAADHELIAETLEMRKRERRGDVISTLLDARDKGEPFSDDDIIGLANFVIAAGIDTTGSLLASTFILLTERPDIRERLITEPALIPQSFDEFMRLFTPTQGLCRTVTRDTVLGGQQLRRGDRAMLCFAASCRDPREYENPGEFRLDRKPKPNFAFGGGNHRCLGSQFARLEFEITLSTVLQRMPDFAVDLGAVQPFDNVGVVTGYRQVLAKFTPAGSVEADLGIPGWGS